MNLFYEKPRKNIFLALILTVEDMPFFLKDSHLLNTNKVSFEKNLTLTIGDPRVNKLTWVSVATESHGDLPAAICLSINFDLMNSFLAEGLLELN